MMIKRIPGATRVLGKEQGFTGLPIRDTHINFADNGPDTPCMETLWEPTPAELEKLNRGGYIKLRVLGTGHPPVMLEVE